MKIIRGSKLHDDLRHAVSGARLEDKKCWADNLSIALCTYFSQHEDRPEGDELTEDEGNSYWGEWVSSKADEAIELILESVTEEINKGN